MRNPLLSKATLCCLLLLLGLSARAPRVRAQEAAGGAQKTASIQLRWGGKRGVERYRLQLATDEAFSDIVYDQAVVGREHLVEGLAPGKYFWRVAPAVGETGTYSRPFPVVIGAAPAGGAAPARAEVVLPPASGGWRTGTGEVMQPRPARLRAGAVVDLICVNSEGMAFALDGSNGVAMWTARYRPDARRGEETGMKGKAAPFTPLVVERGESDANIVVAYDGGVRALRGATGREFWRARFEGRAAGGASADLNGDGAKEVVVVTADPDRLYVIEAETGRVVANEKLDAEAVGAPHAFSVGDSRGVVMALKNGKLEVRGAEGKVVREEKLKAEITTTPLVFTRGGAALMVVGTDQGLVALTVSDLKALGRIAVENDMPRGTLSAADLDGDGASEIVMVTKRGRVAVVSTIDGEVKWYSEGATDASSAAFADVNGDGVQDVLVPGGATFALAFSGRDGALLWKVEEAAGGRSPAAAGAEGSLRALVIAPAAAGAGSILVGGDSARVGLRAVELPKGTTRAESR